MDDIALPLKPRFVIVKDFDRPSEKFIAELAEDGLYYYIHPELRSRWAKQGLSEMRATSLEDFGMEVNIEDDVFYCHYENESKAKYPDGRQRFWQGEPRFNFRYPGLPDTKVMFNIFDHLTNPDDIGADEYRAIYECLQETRAMQNPEFAIAICEEFQDHAASIITKLQKAMEAALRA